MIHVEAIWCIVFVVVVVQFSMFIAVRFSTIDVRWVLSDQVFVSERTEGWEEGGRAGCLGVSGLWGSTGGGALVVFCGSHLIIIIFHWEIQI